MEKSNTWFLEMPREHFKMAVENKPEWLEKFENWVATVISGFSGVWKDTIIQKIINYNYVKAVSSTTRDMRIWEINGIDYNFISKSEFERKNHNWGFLDKYQNSKWDLYWLSKDELLKLKEFKSVLFNVVPSTWELIQDIIKDKVARIIILPESFEQWKERLFARDDGMSQFEKKLRIEQDIEENFLKYISDINIVMKNWWKITYRNGVYYVINWNNDLKDAIKNIKYIITRTLNKTLIIN